MAEGTGDEDNLQEADEELGRDKEEQGAQKMAQVWALQGPRPGHMPECLV